MAATVKIFRITGSLSGVATDITGLNTRANAVDSHSTGDTSSPIQIPSAGSNNYSYWVSTRLAITAAPAGTINNLRWYTDGGNGFGTGVTCWGAKASTGSGAGYRQASGLTGTGAQLTQTNHTGLDEAPVNVFTYTSGSPKSLNGSMTAATGSIGDHFVYQIWVSGNASPGATPSEQFSWRYDET
jgi:hypothetical protein